MALNTKRLRVNMQLSNKLPSTNKLAEKYLDCKHTATRIMNKIPLTHLITMLIILGGAVVVIGAAVYKLASWVLSL